MFRPCHRSGRRRGRVRQAVEGRPLGRCGRVRARPVGPMPSCSIPRRQGREDDDPPPGPALVDVRLGDSPDDVEDARTSSAARKESLTESLVAIYSISMTSGLWAADGPM